MIASLWLSLEQAVLRLLHASWQGALLALLVLALAWFLGDRLRPRWRFALWLVVFARLALPALPSAPWSVFRFVPLKSAELTIAPAVTDSSIDRPAAERATIHPKVMGKEASAHPAKGNVPAASAPRRPDEPRSLSPGRPLQSSRNLCLDALAAIWFLGVVALTLRSVGASVRMARLRREWREVTDASLLGHFHDCRRELHVRGAVSLCAAGHDAGPATCGVVRPCIVIPQNLLTSLSPEDLRFVLLHELVHVARRDVLLDRVVATIAALHWFNPLAWLALASLRQDRELACDAIVLSRVGVHEARRYGRVLLDAIETLRSTLPAAGAVGAFDWLTRHSLNRRILMIAGYRAPEAWSPILGLAALVALVAVGLTDAQDEPQATIKAEKTATRSADATAGAGSRFKARADDIPVDFYGDPLPAGAMARLGTMRLRHGQAKFVFSPDSRTLVSWNHSEIRFWDPADGSLLRTLAPREFVIQAVVFSPDGRSLAAGGFWPDKPFAKNMVKVWDPATLAERFAAKVPGRDNVLGVCFVDRGATVVVASDGVVHAWDVATGARALEMEIDKTLRAEARWVARLAVSPDETTLAVEMTNGPLSLWNWPAGGARQLSPHFSNASLVFSPDGKLLAACNDSRSHLDLYDVATGQLVRTHEGVRGAAFSPDGKLMVCYSSVAGALLLVDPATGGEVRRIEGPERSCSPDWKLMFGADDAGMQIWDVATDKPRLAPRPGHTAGIIWEGIAFTPDGKQIVTAAEDNTVRTWDAATGRPLAVLRHDGNVRGLAVSRDGRTIASSSTDDTVRLWNLTDGNEGHRLAGHGRDRAFVVYKRPLAFTPDGKRLGSFGDDMFLRLWDVARQKLIAEHDLRPGGVNFRKDPPGRHGPGIQAVGFSPDARLFAVAFQQKATSVPPGSPPPTLYVWDVASGKTVGEVELAETAKVDSITFSRDGKRVFTRAWGKIRVWSLPAGKFEQEIVAPGGTGLAMALLDDDSVVALGVVGSERAIYLLDAADGRDLLKIDGVPGDMRSLAFSSDGRRLAVGLDSGEALVYDVGTDVPRR
jgi:WD40 repeat protein/beta-lactamase regulating signal transducer with metallopeptidase domain